MGKIGIREGTEHAEVHEALREHSFAVIERFAPQARSKDGARTRSLAGNFSRLK